MIVYFISGLGADSSIFKHIQLPHFCKPVYLDWIPPQPAETLPAYALRLATSIDTTNPFALIGLSFGGMLATEIAFSLKPVCVILISSIPTVQHLPNYFRLAAVLRLHKIIPIGLIRQASILKRLFTIETATDKKHLRAMIRKSDVQFIRWAMHAVLTWKNTAVPENLVHIHGTRDEVLPMRFTKPTHIVRGGGHLMVLTRANEINVIIDAVLNNAVANV